MRIPHLRNSTTPLPAKGAEADSLLAEARCRFSKPPDEFRSSSLASLLLLALESIPRSSPRSVRRTCPSPSSGHTGAPVAPLFESALMAFSWWFSGPAPLSRLLPSYRSISEHPFSPAVTLASGYAINVRTRRSSSPCSAPALERRLARVAARRLPERGLRQARGGRRGAPLSPSRWRPSPAPREVRCSRTSTSNSAAFARIFHALGRSPTARGQTPSILGRRRPEVRHRTWSR